MVEDTPTLGSVETSVYTKQNLALCSRTFNLKNSTFCELFPDIVTEIKSKLDKSEQNKKKGDSANKQSGDSDKAEELVQYRRDAEDANRSISNLAIIIGVAAFGFVVNSIIKSI